METKLYRIYDTQCQRYKGDGSIYTSVRQMVEELADYHDIDFESGEEGFENETMLQRYDRKFDNDQARLDDLCEYGEWEIHELSKKDLIDEIITIERYDLHNNAETDNPLDEIQIYRETLEKLPIEVLQSYIDEEITSDELYDEFISKL